MALQTLLGLSVLGALVTTIGSLIALFLKDFVAATWLERWKARQTLLGAYRRYQMPIFLAAEELSNRLYGLSRDNNDREQLEVGLAVLKKPIVREPSAAVNDHYLRYRFVSNVYRLCSFLGWVELYRRDIESLNVDELDRNRRLDACLRNIQSVLADGWINQHKDWQDWSDCLIFREELRAIGHAMLPPSDNLCILDFGSFTSVLEHDPDGTEAARWFVQAAQFFECLKRDQDFRLIRMRMLVVYLTDLMELLQPKRIDRSHITTAKAYRISFDTITGGPKWSQTPLPGGALPINR
ncbi:MULTISPECIES: hypothetical protein [Sphingomonadaceae]|uniref:hypothetical protein n=1 Tax=Sphingomonadales TaxID=204457 RepID=UPI001E133D07|nr:MULTISPECIES: hypothetical protein [Sphingomonadaceae]MBX9663018.1 hypothetical protein [Novosphingobium sp.]MBY0621138.1 hypothetical protein [Sphingomonas ursincola]